MVGMSECNNGIIDEALVNQLLITQGCLRMITTPSRDCYTLECSNNTVKFIKILHTAL